jgi:hypothetical protein
MCNVSRTLSPGIGNTNGDEFMEDNTARWHADRREWRKRQETGRSRTPDLSERDFRTLVKSFKDVESKNYRYKKYVRLATMTDALNEAWENSHE